MSSNNDDTQLVQVFYEDSVHGLYKVGWGIGGGKVEYRPGFY